MDEFQDIIAEIAINTGNAEKQLDALQRGMASVEQQLQKAKKGSEQYAAALNRQQLLQRQQQTLFQRYSAQVREAEQVQEALNAELVRTTQEFGKESTAAQRATNAIKAQAAEVEKLAASAAKIGNAKLGVSMPKGGVLSELGGAVGGELTNIITGLTGSVGQLGGAIGGLGLTGAAVATGGIAAAVAGVIALGTASVQTAAKFEKMRTTLKTTFGSEGVARQVQQQLIEFAANTPFGVEQITESYIQLANRGLKLTNEQLTNLGDFAAATGKDMSQLVEAIADVNNQERWSEFGVKVQTSGNKIIGTFKGVTREFERSEAGASAMVQAFGLMPGVAGGMEAQSKTLDGQLSNLSDTLDQLYNNLGILILPIAKAFVSSLSGMIDAVNKLTSVIPAFDKMAESFGKMQAPITYILSGLADLAGGFANSYDKIAQAQGEIISKSQSEAEALEQMSKRYSELNALSGKTIHVREEMAQIQAQMVGLVGKEAIALDENSNVIGLNTEAVNEAIKARKLLANTEIAALIEGTEGISQELARVNAQLEIARRGNTEQSQRIANKLEEERETLMQRQNAAKQELLKLGVDETEQANAILVIQTQRVENELKILESKQNQLKEEIASRNEQEQLLRLENESAQAALIANGNLQKIAESGIKQRELDVKLSEQRRKLQKELQQVILNTNNAETQSKKIKTDIDKLETKRNGLHKVRDAAQIAEINNTIEAAKKQDDVLQKIIKGNEELAKRNKELTGFNEATNTFEGGILEDTTRKQKQALAQQAREAARAYQRELAEQRRKIQQMILDVEDEQNKLLLEKTTERTEKEFEVAKRKNALELQAAIDSYKEDSRNKGLKAAEIESGIDAIKAKFRLLDIQAERKKEQELFEIKKLYADKERALNTERIKAEIKEAEVLLSQSFDANISEQIVNQIADLNKKIAAQEFEAQEAALKRELELAKNNAEAKSRIELDLSTLRAKALADQKAAELKLIDDVAKAREEAIKDEFTKRAALREQSEGQSESEFLKKEAESIGKIFGGQRRLQRERDRELRQQEITRAKERSELANAQLKEAEKLNDQEIASFGKARADTEIKLEQARANRIKAENEVAVKTNENTKKTLEERIAAFEEIKDYTNQVADLTVNGIRQINEANEQRRQKELEIAQNRLDILYRDLELGRQVNEEVIRREQERIQKINEERKRAAEQERALTLGQIVLQQVLAVASAAASAAKTTQWFTIPIAVASALLAIGAGARQARANVAGFRKGVIRLHGGKDENAQDTVPAILAKGESVMTVSETNRAEKILTAIRKGELSDKDLFGRGGLLYKERNMTATQKTANNDFALAEKFDRLIAAVEGVPSVRVSADADGLVKYTTRRQRRSEAIKKR